MMSFWQWVYVSFLNSHWITSCLFSLTNVAPWKYALGEDRVVFYSCSQCGPCLDFVRAAVVTEIPEVEVPHPPLEFIPTLGERRHSNHVIGKPSIYMSHFIRSSYLSGGWVYKNQKLRIFLTYVHNLSLSFERLSTLIWMWFFDGL